MVLKMGDVSSDSGVISANPSEKSLYPQPNLDQVKNPSSSQNPQFEESLALEARGIYQAEVAIIEDSDCENEETCSISSSREDILSNMAEFRLEHCASRADSSSASSNVFDDQEIVHLSMEDKDDSGIIELSPQSPDIPDAGISPLINVELDSVQVPGLPLIPTDQVEDQKCDDIEDEYASVLRLKEVVLNTINSLDDGDETSSMNDDLSIPKDLPPKRSRSSERRDSDIPYDNPKKLSLARDSIADEPIYAEVRRPPRRVDSGFLENSNTGDNSDSSSDKFLSVKFTLFGGNERRDSRAKKASPEFEEAPAKNEKNRTGYPAEHIYETLDYTLLNPSKIDDSRSSRSSSTSVPYSEERLYEDIAELRAKPPPVPPHQGVGGGDSGGPIDEGSSVPWFSRRLQHHRPLSSSDSWGSEDFESGSSNDEEDHLTEENVKEEEGKGVVSENFKQRLLRKREQWRERRQSSRTLKFSLRKDSKEKITKESPLETPELDAVSNSSSGESRLSRWFSLRKSNYDVEKKATQPVAPADRLHHNPSFYYTLLNGAPPVSAQMHTGHQRMPRLAEEPFDMKCLESSFKRLPHSPTLPPIPKGLPPERVKRRHILASIVHSENNYVSTLLRIVNDYQKPLSESKPAILNPAKQAILFHYVADILQIHLLFRIALTDAIRLWDKEEAIGDVFVASFSKSQILEVYSEFINNFSKAMDLAKQEAKKKSAFADFLKMRQITSSDRLSFIGLMVKPVQRFPQFILFLQDLLKHTPPGHHDRMSLQLALTQLESLAEMLNERKREAEQVQAFRDTLKHINTKFALRGISEGSRFMLRQDDVAQLEFASSGQLSKKKDRRLFLTNDLVICVSVICQKGEDLNLNGERLSLKWAHPVADVEISENNSSPTLSRVLAGGQKSSQNSNPSKILGTSLFETPEVDSLVQDMNNLMHDYGVITSIQAMVSSLKGTYDGLNENSLNNILSVIQRSIHEKDDQMSWVDACNLEFVVTSKDGKKETITYQTTDPSIKKDWQVELRLAQLALAKENSPAWDLPETERRPATKMPLFVKSMPVFSSKHNTEVKCGCCYTVVHPRVSQGTNRNLVYLWLCSSDGVSSHLTVFQVHQVLLREVIQVDFTEVCITAVTHVPPLYLSNGSREESGFLSHTIWIGTDSHRLHIYSGIDPEKQLELASTSVPSAITTIKYHCDQVFVGLSNGSVLIYRRELNGDWLLKDPTIVSLASEPVAALLPISTSVYIACESEIYVLDCFTQTVTSHFLVQHMDDGDEGAVLLAHSGIGLWITQSKSCTICLYHTETFKHLQDINVASMVSKMLKESGSATVSEIFVTALMASKGLLWVGTNVGVVLTIPLPRLEGVPIISGRANVSYHGHAGPISLLLALQSQSTRPSLQSSLPDPRLQKGGRQEFDKQASRCSTVPPSFNNNLNKPKTDGESNGEHKGAMANLKSQMISPILLRRKREQLNYGSKRLSRTLPKGIGANFGSASSQEYDIYGLCSSLLKGYNGDDPMSSADHDGGNGLSGNLLSRYDSLRRSDPEMALPTQFSSLDRRVRLRASRPRSLDLSTWSVDSRGSSHCTTISSGSEDCHVTPCDVQTVAAKVSRRRKDLDQPRTLMVITGGRGYATWQSGDKDDKDSIENEKDAHVIVWEIKL